MVAENVDGEGAPPSVGARTPAPLADLVPPLLLLTVQLASLYWLGHRTAPGAGFPLDDAWIHQVVARNFARTGHLAFPGGQFGAAATSVLWAVLLGANEAWVHAAPSAFAFALNAVLFVASGQLVLAMARADGYAPSTAFGLAALFSAAANHVWFVFSGMEACLLVAASVAAVHAWCAGRPLLAGFACAVAFACRPEALGLVAVLAVLARPAGRNAREALRLVAPVAAYAALYFSMIRISTGSFGPSTFAGRRWMWLQDRPAATQLDLVRELLEVWAHRLFRYTLGKPPPWLFWIAVGLAAVGAVTLVRERRRRLSLILLWTLAHLGAYAVLLPAEGHGGRYQPLVPGMFLALSWLGADSLTRATLAHVRRSPGWQAGVLRLTVAAPWLLAVTSSLTAWSSAQAMAVRHIQDTEVGMGLHLRSLPRDARIASFDIGGIGYFSDRLLLDLGGLADGSVIARVRRGELWDYLLEQRIDYVVVPVAFDAGFPDPWNFYHRLGLDLAPATGLELTHMTASTQAVWAEGLNATLHGAPRQLLLRVKREGGSP